MIVFREYDFINNNKRIAFILIIVQCLIFSNCRKDSKQGNALLQEMTEILTKDTLTFESYVINWNTPAERTIYKRGAIDSSLNLNDAWYKFDKDGTYKSHALYNLDYNSSWEFLDDGKKLRIWNNEKTVDQVVTILKLSKDTIEWIDPGNYNLFYRLEPK